jgi:acetyl esterase/lipase
VPLGITTVVLNYELCPASTLDGVVSSTLAGFEWTRRHVGEYGGDARNIAVHGHSMEADSIIVRAIRAHAGRSVSSLCSRVGSHPQRREHATAACSAL